MTSTLSPDNAIAWAQVRLRGGWKNLAVTGFAYAMLVGGGIYASAKLLASSPGAAYGGWLTGLLGLQAAVLLLFGASRIGAAIRLDHSTRMIESHRLMPIGGGQAVLGYIAGAASQAMVLGVVNVVLGMGVAVGAGIPFATWLAANLVLASFAAFIWVLSAFWAFLIKAPFTLFVILGLGTWVTQGMVLQIVPALTALIGPIAGRSVFSFRASTTDLNFANCVSFLAQFFIGGICFIGAARRFRRGDAPAFTLPLSLLLLAGWVAISCVTIHWWDDFKPAFMPGVTISTESQLVGSLSASMLLALTPIAGSARAQCDWRSRVPNDPRSRRRPMPFPIVVLMATLIVLCLTWVESSPGTITLLWNRVLSTGIVAFLFLLSVGYLLQVLIRCGIRPLAPVVIWLALGWLGPLLGDVVRFNLMADNHGTVLQSISTCSPLGAMLQIWSIGDYSRSEPIDTAMGIAAQALVAIIFFLLDAMTRRSTTAA